MPFMKTAICTTALAIAMMSSQIAHAGSKGTPNHGVSTNAPGQLPPPTSGPGKSENAPGDIKKDSDLKDAKTIAPGATNLNKK